MASSSSSLSLEARLSALERQVGGAGGATPTPAAAAAAATTTTSTTTTTLSNRLEALQTSATTVISSNHRDTWKESLKLLEELDPGMALTHQEQPLFYKRQQVLAAADPLKSDFGELRKIQHALASNGNNNNNNKDIDQAPILTEYPPCDQKRLDSLKLKVSGIFDRTQTLMTEFDQMLEVYHQCMTAASEKCVMAEESIAARSQTSI